MATTAPPDPYRTLGVDASADSAAIKKAYRKLVLSCHPDKVTDESLKAQKQEEFHQIQQAYETIGDPDKRTKYDLELKAKKLREERDRAMPRNSTPQSRNVNINIYTAPHPSEYRSSSSKHSSPAKPASYKPYSAEFSKSCEHDIPNRSRAYQEEKKTRRTYSDERLNDERKRREDDRERERLHRRRQEEEDERRRRQARREKEERELKERARAKEAAKRRERELREQQERDDRIRAEIRAEKKAKERAAEAKRKQDLAEEKQRAKMRSQEHTSEEDDDRRSRAKKSSSSSSKKESPRDKTPSKYRERSSPRDEPVPDLPTSTADALESKMAYAALYIRGQQAKKSAKTSPKHTADTPTFSDAYPDPEQWKPKRRVSGEKTPKAAAAAAAAEAIINDATSPPISAATQQAPPRLHKAYTMGSMPASVDPRPSLGRSQTFDQEAFARSMGPERPRLSRQRTSIDEEDYYTPRVQKYTVRPDRTVYETSQHREPYVGGPIFPKIKTTQSYGPDNVSHSKRYDQADLTFVDYPTAQQQAYVATHS